MLSVINHLSYTPPLPCQVYKGLQPVYSPPGRSPQQKWCTGLYSTASAPKRSGCSESTIFVIASGFCCPPLC
ncbi:hypothetical protein K466DRAFT_582076 [Polyporus arcularius HHB13444]|uniref:Uncharacterized protein n=1 Tax=Polyporus arcularius HHB13444 TaxID=1314778 RepID=A0A5C3PR69_9APHY|nr:hypothetical protein K466DRAFT_582076 [Polyporus arcularius HHB13444]